MARKGNPDIIYRSDASTFERTPGHLAEYTWNHTTLRALQVDPTVTYLQVRYGGPDPLAKVAKVRETFGAEVLQHLECDARERRGHFSRPADGRFHHARSGWRRSCACTRRWAA
jgi:hypothetical protein